MGSSCQFWERQKEPTQHQALLPPGISQNTCKSKMLMVADFRVWIYAHLCKRFLGTSVLAFD